MKSEHRCARKANHAADSVVADLAVVDGQVVVRSMMNLSSSFDHRVVDGADAARFVQAIKTLLEQPASLFLV